MELLAQSREVAVAPFLVWLPHSPDGAILLASAGVLLIFFELNRPGTILPGAAGLLFFLFALATLAGFPLNTWAVLLALAGVVVLLLNLRLQLPRLALVAAVAVLMAGLRALVPRSAAAQVHLPVALGCGLVLGGSGAVLSRIAFRARQAKQVN